MSSFNIVFSNLIIGDKKNEKYKGENHVYLDVAPIFENLSNVDNDFMVLFENNSDAIECYKYCKKIVLMRYTQKVLVLQIKNLRMITLN